MTSVLIYNVKDLFLYCGKINLRGTLKTLVKIYPCTFLKPNSSKTLKHSFHPTSAKPSASLVSRPFQGSSRVKDIRRTLVASHSVYEFQELMEITVD